MPRSNRLERLARLLLIVSLCYITRREKWSCFSDARAQCGVPQGVHIAYASLRRPGAAVGSGLLRVLLRAHSDTRDDRSLRCTSNDGRATSAEAPIKVGTPRHDVASKGDLEERSLQSVAAGRGLGVMMGRRERLTTRSLISTLRPISTACCTSVTHCKNLQTLDQSPLLAAQLVTDKRSADGLMYPWRVVRPTSR